MSDHVSLDARPAAGSTDHDRATSAVSLTSDEVWAHLAKGSFLVLSHVTPAGEPRSSGVLFKTKDRRVYVAAAPTSWKVKHIAANPHVAATVCVRRGGLLSLVAPIPPATINFHARAIVHEAGTFDLPDELAPLVPPERRASACVIELVPEGFFRTYGIGVPLMKMRDTEASGARVPVGR